MVDIVKQDMTYLWAVSGDVVAPDNTKIQEGWGIEVVPRQWWNWMQYRADSNLAYVLQKGIPEWDATTEYIANKSFVSSGGIVYKCLITNTGLAPLTNPTQWVRAFQDFTTASSALGALTPAADRLPYFNGTGTAALTTLTSFARTLLDDTTNTAARTTLGAQASHANLTALSGVTAAINTFPYWTSTTAMAAAPITAFARTILDDADATAVRATLGLGTAATQNTTTSTTDSTIGNLLRVGDFGMAGSQTGVAIPGNDADTIVYTGVYNITGATTNGPSGFGSGSIILHLACSAGAYHQIAINYTNGTQMAFRRRHSTNGWLAWQSITTSTDLQNALSGVGLGVTASPQTIADLDSTSTPTGFYRAIQSTTTGTYPSGAGLSGTVIVERYTATNLKQIYAPNGNLTGGGKVYTRTYNATTSSWLPWSEIVFAEAPTINNANLTGTTTVPGGSVLKVGTTYTDNTSSVLYVNNGFNNGTNGITVDSFAPTISFIDRTTNSSGSRWRQDGNILRFDSTADNGATWSTSNLLGINATGNLGVSGALGIATVGIDVGIQAAGGTNITGTTQIGVRSHFNVGADATTVGMGFNSENSIGNGTTTATTARFADFNANTQTVNENHTVTEAACFYAADKANTGFAKVFGFDGRLATRAGVERWNLYAQGTAPNYIRGQTVIGGTVTTLPAANVALQVTGDQTVSGTLTAGTVTATNINATNFTVSGSFNPTNMTVSGNVTAANLSATGSLYATAGGTIKDVLYVPAVNSSSNSHIWFQDSSGNTTGIVYAEPNGTLRLRAGGNIGATFFNSGGASFNAITCSGGLSCNSGSVITTRGGVPVNATMCSYAQYQALSNDGTPPAYSFHRVGDFALAMYMNSANEIHLMGSNGVNREVINNGNLNWWISQNQQVSLGGVGTYAFMRTAVAATFGVPVAAANLTYGSTGSNGGTPAGTWMSLGWAGAGNHTLFVRIA